VTTSAVALQYFNLASLSVAVNLDVTGVVFSSFAAYFHGGHPEELGLWTSGDSRGARLVRRLSRWSARYDPQPGRAASSPYTGVRRMTDARLTRPARAGFSELMSI